MTLRLDPPITVGAVRVQALSRTRVRGNAHRSGVSGHASKTPVAIVITDVSGRHVFNLGVLPLNAAAQAMLFEQSEAE